MVQDVLLGPVHNAPNNVFGVMDRILAPGAVARACSASTYRMQGRVVSIKGFVLVDAYRNSGHGVPGNTDASQMVRLAVPRDTNAAGQANTNNTIVVVSAPATMSSQADADVAASRETFRPLPNLTVLCPDRDAMNQTDDAGNNNTIAGDSLTQSPETTNANLPQSGSVMRLDPTPRDHASFGLGDLSTTPSQSTVCFPRVTAI
ncbi:uncharacterized protein J7T55_014438 [Diaporthe amygdali]|uniref:uncharacterized protein n=1 Tax=Phomopsis amygdali TaxID=1214568 RepID=UPI0022FDC86F|nr:uncharacterized protein J7T55_014438 [Diaporthe amygdali]KAJ0117987.1 uncharacterized protein J7T55_014438 [Diaporthe amygdali]